jgi:cytidine deaminase
MKNQQLNCLWTPDQAFILEQQAFINSEIKKLGPKKLLELADSAARARKLSYSPYSDYPVGAALLTTSAKIYLGTNIERASYSETNHAEETAVTAAILDKAIEKEGRRFIRAMAVAHTGTSASCGRCRQIMAEHADNCLVIMADIKGQINSITSLRLLLPMAFTPTDLGTD